MRRGYGKQSSYGWTFGRVDVKDKRSGLYYYDCPTCGIGFGNVDEQKVKDGVFWHALVCDGNPLRFWGKSAWPHE